MKAVKTLLLSLFMLAISIGLAAQQTPSAPGASPQTMPSPSTSQQPTMPSADDTHTSTQPKSFSGKIVKSGEKFVLTDATGKTTYQLDDQQKAQAFLDKNVTVTGILDASTGTIRVTAIDPA